MSTKQEKGSVPYFPPLNGNVECHKCEISTKCWCNGKYQRDLRDFTHTSGRCPRLADKRGFVEKSERELYAATFPLIHAEQGCEELHLTLKIPGDNRYRKVYNKNTYWFYRTKENGYAIRKIIFIGAFHSKKEISDYMEHLQADYCVFQCVITEYFL